MKRNASRGEPVVEHRKPIEVVRREDDLTGHLLHLGPDVTVARGLLGGHQAERTGNTP